MKGLVRFVSKPRTTRRSPRSDSGTILKSSPWAFSGTKGADEAEEGRKKRKEERRRSLEMDLSSFAINFIRRLRRITLLFLAREELPGEVFGSCLVARENRVNFFKILGGKPDLERRDRSLELGHSPGANNRGGHGLPG